MVYNKQHNCIVLLHQIIFALLCGIILYLALALPKSKNIEHQETIWYYEHFNFYYKRYQMLMYKLFCIQKRQIDKPTDDLNNQLVVTVKQINNIVNKYNSKEKYFKESYKKKGLPVKLPKIYIQRKSKNNQFR